MNYLRQAAELYELLVSLDLLHVDYSEYLRNSKYLRNKCKENNDLFSVRKDLDKIYVYSSKDSKTLEHIAKLLLIIKDELIQNERR